ncbi:hypothetical protein AM305_05038, partial [Actinobacillus minor NM305]
ETGAKGKDGSIVEVSKNGDTTTINVKDAESNTVTSTA